MGLQKDPLMHSKGRRISPRKAAGLGRERIHGALQLSGADAGPLQKQRAQRRPLRALPWCRSACGRDFPAGSFWGGHRVVEERLET